MNFCINLLSKKQNEDHALYVVFVSYSVDLASFQKHLLITLNILLFFAKFQGVL